MTYKYNPFWQQRIRETVLHALNVHPRLTALRVDLHLPDVPAATDAAVISRFINALKARIDAYQKRKHREGKRVHPTTLHYACAYSALFDHGLASKSDQRFASIRSTGNLTFSTAF